MPCYHPLRAGLTDGPEGRSLVWGKVPHAVPGVKPISLPCGRCIGCRQERGRQWAVRLMHENKLHEESIFVTLTFNDESLPKDLSLSVPTCQLFIKKLREAIQPQQKTGEKKPPRKKIKFFMSGEYGDELQRPHYHAIIFGWTPPDPRFYKKSGENNLYTSEKLDAIWGNGFCNFGAVSFDSASYVAKYTTKKITGEQALKHYGGRKPEFAIMSRGGNKKDGGGIAHGWIKKFRTDVYPSDEVLSNGARARPPRYYDQYLEKTDPELLEQLKLKREAAAGKLEKYMRKSGAIYVAEMNNAHRLAVREKYAEAKASLKGAST